MPTGLGVRLSGDIALSGSGFKPVQVSPNGIAQSQVAGIFAVGVNDLLVLAGGDVAVAGLRIVAGDDTAFAVARFTASDLVDGPDTVPDPFAFTTQTGLETEFIATSNSVTIQGIDAPAAVTISGGDYSLGCTADFTSAPGTISDGETVCVRTTTPDDGESDSRVSLTVGGVQGQFTVITGDAEPDDFTFVNQTGVAPNAQIVSAPVTLTGFAIRTDVSVSAGSQFSVGCDGNFTVSTTTVDPGVQVCVRHTSAATVGGTTITTLTVGKGATVPGTFTSTTGPAQFNFIDQPGVARSTVIVSAPVTLTGFTTAAAISVSGGEYSVGCTGSFTSTAATVTAGATVCVRHTSSAAGGTATNTVLTVGSAPGVSDTFTSTTEGVTDTTPDAFSFPAQTSVPLATVVTSGVITIGGFDTATAISVTGGAYSRNCASNGFTSASGTLAPNTPVCVRHTSASAAPRSPAPYSPLAA